MGERDSSERLKQHIEEELRKQLSLPLEETQQLSLQFAQLTEPKREPQR